MERDTPVVENAPNEGASNVQETQQPPPEVNNSSQLEDDRLIARARAVGVDYEFAKPGELEPKDYRRKRQRRNQRRISEQGKRLREVVGDLPPPPPAGSSQQEDNVYSAIRAFEVEQMTYAFFFCEVCKEWRLECKGTRNMCTRCRRDKKVPNVWSGENNIDPMAVPEILSNMSDADSQASTYCACTPTEASRYCLKGTLHCFPTGCARTGHYSSTPTSRSTGKNNGFPFLDIFGYLKNTH